MDAATFLSDCAPCPVKQNEAGICIAGCDACTGKAGRLHVAVKSPEGDGAQIMLSLISALSRKQKSWIFLAVDLLLCPLALLFTFSVQVPPQSAVASFTALLPVLPYVLAVTAGLSLWLGIPYVQLIAYERHAVGLTALVALATAAAAAGLNGLFGPRLPLGIYVVFGLSYFFSMLAARALLYRAVLAVYRQARPGCRVL
ncbi:MAG: hypothetical protein JKX76_00425, partial [Colwellia sp.]|nr:hypothetical protein [Colwellia sp.]